MGALYDPMNSRHRKHMVPVDGIDHVVFDSIKAARFANQSGRGNYRHGFDMNSMQYALFKEVDNGSYKRITNYSTINN
jgi:hypothetical protein